MANRSADRIPVIIGVGQINDRPASPGDGLDAFGLMQAALAAAEQDSGVAVLQRLDWLGVEDQISFPEPLLHQRLARGLPRLPAHVIRTEVAGGEGPVQLINDAARLIASGEVSVAAAVGGEAMRTAAARAREAAERSGNTGVDRMTEATTLLATPLALRYGLVNPTDIYPLYENASRSVWGQTLSQAQAETAEIWSGFSAVAAANPNAWLRKALPPSAIAEVTPDNRMISFPYTKLMVANSSVNQGAAVILSSLAAARELGIAEDRLVYVWRGAAAHEVDDVLKRDGYTHSPALRATVAKVLEFNELDPGTIDHVELYSCFPCVPKMARRLLGWPLERPHSVYGGLTFGGGPIGNCMMHAAAAMVEKLRAGGANATGLIVANGGFATHNHAIVLKRQAAGEQIDLAGDYHVQSASDAIRGKVPPLLEEYAGPGRVESYAIPFNRHGPSYAAVIGRTPADERFMAHVPPEDVATLQLLMSGSASLIGSPGNAVPAPDGRSHWKPVSA